MGAPSSASARAQVVVGVLVHVERERLGVFVRVPDGEPAVGPLDQQQLGAGPAGGGGLCRQQVPAPLTLAAAEAGLLTAQQEVFANPSPVIPVTNEPLPARFR